MENFLVDMIDIPENKESIVILKLFVDKACNLLSEEQKNVFKEVLQENLETCEKCDEFLWPKACDIIDSGFCGWCEKMRNS